MQKIKTKEAIGIEMGISTIRGDIDLSGENSVVILTDVGDAEGGCRSAVRTNRGDAKSDNWSAVRTDKGDAEGGGSSAVRTFKGNAKGGYDSAVRTYEGDAEGGDCSAVRTGVGDAKGGYGSAVKTGKGLARVGGHGVAMGTEVKVGKNSVGVVTDEKGDIKEVWINADKDSIKVKYGSGREEKMIPIGDKKYSEATIIEALREKGVC